MPDQTVFIVCSGVPRSPTPVSSGAQAPVVFRPPPGPLLYRWFAGERYPLKWGGQLATASITMWGVRS
jgi:hypothetical protein